jgi:hypothetical protein
MKGEIGRDNDLSEILIYQGLYVSKNGGEFIRVRVSLFKTASQ